MSLRYLTMPKWGIEMTQGTLTEWLVKEGEIVTKGQLIALIETDKITNEMEADADGVMHKLCVPEGEVKLVGELLAVTGEASESADALASFLTAFVAPDTSMAAGDSAPAAQADAPAKTATARPEPEDVTSSVSEADFADIKISPAAKRRAIAIGLEPSMITSTSRRGRISMQDVEQSAIAHGLMSVGGVDDAGGAAPASYSNEPTIATMSAMRKTVARRLSEAKSTIPHFYLRADIRMDALLAGKALYASSKGVKVSVNDLLIKAAALALIENPEVNVQLHGDDIHSFAHADIAVAVATPRGLVTPVIRSADLRVLSDISDAIKDMATRAKNNKLTREDIAAGTFTLSNLGMFGVDQFDAIINPPQCAILAVGTSRSVWTQQGDGGVFASYVTCSLSCDHRAIDGAVGAGFLKSLKSLIETPKRLFE